MNRDDSIKLFERVEAVRKKALDAGKPEGEAHEAAKAEWNGWAEALLAERKALEENGEWDADLGWVTLSDNREVYKQVGKNDETKAWFEKADLDFSSLRFITSEDKLKNEPQGGDSDDGQEDEDVKTVIGTSAVQRFDGYQFPGNADFGSATFSRYANFRSTTFTGNANFQSATFTGDAKFQSATFSRDASFWTATFTGDADFQSATFSRGASFWTATFTGDADFQSATFSRDAYFWSATFTGYAKFESATFTGNAKFESATFTGNANFLIATFSRDAYFWSATFSRDAYFESATFTGNADFWSTTFSRYADFGSATFSRYANFRSTTFTGNANFQSATFTGDANFLSATFTGDAKFLSATFSRDAYFWSATFTGYASFDLVMFEGYADFSKACFESEASFDAVRSEVSLNLSDAEFHRVPNFLNAKFKDEEPPNLDNVKVHKQPWWTFGYDPSPSLSTKYRKLKKMAIQAHYSKGELEFHAQEMRAERFRVEGDWVVWWKPKVLSAAFWFGLFYGAVSDFGRSVWRPAIAWCVLVVLFASFYLSLHPPVQKAGQSVSGMWFAEQSCVPPKLQKDKPSLAQSLEAAGRFGLSMLFPPALMGDGAKSKAAPEGIVPQSKPQWEALDLSIKNGFVFIDWDRSEAALRTYGCLYGLKETKTTLIPQVPLPVTVASILQNVLSAILIFLFGLALRNMLKLK